MGYFKFDFCFLSRDATIIFPANSVATTVSVKMSVFTRDQLPAIIPENGENIAVWLEIKFYKNILFFLGERNIISKCLCYWTIWSSIYFKYRISNSI